jgi:starch phosphorylase
MVREYTERFYLPLATSFRQRAADGARSAVALEHWQNVLTRHWSAIRFGSVVLKPSDAHYQFEVQVYLDDIPPEAVRVELYADPVDGADPVRQPMDRGAPLAGVGNGYVYRATVPAGRPAADYTPRVVPEHPAAVVPLEANRILWYR